MASNSVVSSSSLAGPLDTEGELQPAVDDDFPRRRSREDQRDLSSTTQEGAARTPELSSQLYCQLTGGRGQGSVHSAPQGSHQLTKGGFPCPRRDNWDESIL